MKKEITIFLIILISLLSLEAVFSIKAKDLSGNIKHIKSIDSLIDNVILNQENGMVFLGNSLIGEGINQELLRSYTNNHNIALIVPDGTSIADWYFLSKNKIINKAEPPKKIVIGFAWNALDDSSLVDTSRLGAYFCRTIDIWMVNSLQGNNLNHMAEFIAAKMSSIYANRSYIKKKILVTTIPGYENYVHTVNNRMRPRNHNQENGQKYRLLAEFMKLMRENDITPFFIAMPVVNHYEIDQYIAEIIEESGGYLYDMRSVEGMTSEHFKDPIHLNYSGRDLFTQKLMESVLPQVLNKNVNKKEL